MGKNIKSALQLYYSHEAVPKLRRENPTLFAGPYRWKIINSFDFHMIIWIYSYIIIYNFILFHIISKNKIKYK